MHLSTKTYNHSVGLSATFRQWRASSHCRFLHGYALKFKFVFACTELDENNWVQDFGGLKKLKAELEAAFDHKLVVALDDPSKDQFLALETAGLAQVTLVQRTGCEAFAQLAYGIAMSIVDTDRVRVVSAECSEHEGNSAIFMPDLQGGFNAV